MRCKGCQETRQKRNIKHEREHHILHCLSFKINEGKDYKIYHKPLKHQQGIITVQTAGTALFICNGGAHGRGPLRQVNSGRVTLLPLCHWGSVLPTRASPPRGSLEGHTLQAPSGRSTATVRRRTAHAHLISVRALSPLSAATSSQRSSS